MFCPNCGAQVSGGNFCPYCGTALTETTASISLMNKAVSTANLADEYSLVLVSCGTCDRTTAGDLLEDVFGYSDIESANLISMAPVVVGERLNASEAGTVAQLFSEYGVQVSVTNQEDRYVDLSSHANTSVFDGAGNLLSGVASVIGALTVGNRIRSYRRFKKPSLLERLFRINYRPNPPAYRRSFRPRLDPVPQEPRHTIRKDRPAPRPAMPTMNHNPKPAGGMGGAHPAGQAAPKPSGMGGNKPGMGGSKPGMGGNKPGMGGSKPGAARGGHEPRKR